MSRWKLVLALLAIALLVLCRPCRPAPATFATFNVELYPTARSEPERVARRLAETGSGVVAVQEVRDQVAFEAMLKRASELGERDYRLILSSCGGDTSAITTGVVFDAQQWSLVGSRQYPGLRRDGSCWSDGQAATLAVLDRKTDDLRVAVLSVHFEPHASKFPERRRQWRRLLKITKRVGREFHARPVVLGDFNSTGFTGVPRRERDFIEAVVEDAGFELTTREIACTEYWQPEGNTFEPSVLDHIVVRGDGWSMPEVLGMCADLECRSIPAGSMHEDFKTVSDHCPVRIVAHW